MAIKGLRPFLLARFKVIFSCSVLFQSFLGGYYRRKAYNWRVVGSHDTAATDQQALELLAGHAGQNDDDEWNQDGSRGSDQC